MRKLKLLALFAAALMTANMWAGGSCGDGLTWDYDGGSKTLTISYDGFGTGVMEDYTSQYLVPWYGNRSVMEVISLPAGLKNIGDNAFCLCGLVTSISIPEGVTSIGKDCFNTCTLVASVSLPSTLVTIGEGAFSGCTGLSSITIPEGVTSIGNRCFNACWELETVSLPSTLQSIGNSAFEECKNKLTSITIPANVNSIGTTPFNLCTKLASITVNSSNTTYDSRNNCNAIVRTADNALIVACKNTILPSTITSIKASAFSYLDLGGSTIIIPEGVTSLDQGAFNACSNASISVPKSLSSIGGFIGGAPFLDCEFTSITVHSENTKYDSRNGCNAIIETSTNKLIQASLNTVIPNNVTSIASSAFAGLKSMTSVTIPASVGNIAYGAFYNCNGLTSITCEATTPPTCASNVFSGMPKNIPIYIPSGTKTAYETATGWNYFTNFVDPESAATIQWVCGGCIVKLNTNTGVMTIVPDPEADESYRGGLVSIPDGDDHYAWYEHRTEVTQIVIEDGVGNITGYCFDGCINATSIRIGNDVYSIHNKAFNNCSGLTSIVIPKRATAIGEDSFDGCTGMNDVYCYVNPWDLLHTWGGDSEPYTSHGFKTDGSTKFHVYSGDLTTFVNLWGPTGSKGSRNVTFVGDLDEILTIGDSEGTPLQTQTAIDEFLTGHKGEIIPEMSIQRPVVCNTYYNTVCLPFSMNASQIAASSIADATIKEFAGAHVENDVLHLTLNQVYSIEAGKPYFISYTSDAEDKDKLTFYDVEIAEDEEPAGDTHDGVTFQGTYHGFNMPAGDHNYLFLGQNNTLYWPSVAGYIKPFRAYFIISSGGSAPIRRGMRAVFDDANAPAVVTAIENTESDVQSTKILENGQMIIIRNGVKYNAAGQIVK